MLKVGRKTSSPAPATVLGRTVISTILAAFTTMAATSAICDSTAGGRSGAIFNGRSRSWEKVVGTQTGAVIDIRLFGEAIVIGAGFPPEVSSLQGGRHGRTESRFCFDAA